MQDDHIFLIHPKDCSISRDRPAFPASAVLLDEMGDVIFRVDEDFTDDQIWVVVELINKFYRHGYEHGRSSLATDFIALVGAASMHDVKKLRDELMG